MISSTLYQLIVALVMTLTPPPPQGNWFTCGYTPEPYIQQYQTVVGAWIIDVAVEIKHPTCAGIKDGSIEIRQAWIVNNAIGLVPFIPFELVSTSASGFPLQGSKFENLGAGKYKVVMQFPGHAFRSFDIQLFDQVTPRLVVDKINYESCPGSADGSVELSVVPKNLAYTALAWEDGENGFTRTGLEAGVYPFTFGVDDYDAQCCQNGSITILNNLCLTTLLLWDFGTGLPPGAFDTPSGVLIQSDGLAQFTGEGSVNIPFDAVFQAFVLAKFFFNGIGQIRAFDQNFEEIASMQLDGEGYYRFLFEKAVSHFYIQIIGLPGSQIGSFCAMGLEDDPGDIMVRLNGETDHDRSVPVTVCAGDTINPYTGLSLQGGLTPFTFAWDTDGDGDFADADSLTHPIVFDTAGSYTVGLAISDFSLQTDTLWYDYTVFAKDSVRFAVPDLGVDDTGFEIVTVCSDASSFAIDILNGEAELTASGNGLDSNAFDPAVAGVGTHHITMYRDDCTESGGLFVFVTEQPDASIADMEQLYECSEPIQLSSMVLGDTTGLWSIEDVAAIVNDTLDPALLEPGEYTLWYTIGEGECSDSSSQEFTIAATPQVDLDTLADPLLDTDDPFDLNTLLGSSTPGGTWSGGTYVMNGMFDPGGLSMGAYQVIYTVGEGSCEQRDTTYILVDESVGTGHPTEFVEVTLMPNPVHDELTICVEISINPEVTLVDITGRHFNIQLNIQGNCASASVRDIPAGVYYLSAQPVDRRALIGAKFVKM